MRVSLIALALKDKVAFDGRMNARKAMNGIKEIVQAGAVSGGGPDLPLAVVRAP
jgi:hypothetical protein